MRLGLCNLDEVKKKAFKKVPREVQDGSRIGGHWTHIFPWVNSNIHSYIELLLLWDNWMTNFWTTTKRKRLNREGWETPSVLQKLPEDLGSIIVYVPCNFNGPSESSVWMLWPTWKITTVHSHLHFPEPLPPNIGSNRNNSASSQAPGFPI